MATGDTYIPVLKVWAVLTGGEYDETTRNILLSIRFIRVVVAGLIGVALSVSGLQMQTVFQNPLADPYLLGVSSGAGLGSGSVYTRRSVARMDELLASPIIGYRRFGMDRNGCHPIGSSRHQPESEKYSRRADYGGYDRIRGRCHYPDSAIFEFCRTTENVHALVDGLAQPYHCHPTGSHDSDAVHRSAVLRSLHQVTEPIAAR